VIVYLDTNAAVFLAQRGLARFGREARRLIERGELLFSPMVLLELEYMHEIGRSAARARDIQRKLEHELDARMCDLPFDKIANAALDEKWTRDPFDRIIVSHAKVNGFAPLISSDEKIAQHYPRTVW
jgi:PIN domain nuclease of toxin-antitoxin system